MNSVMDNSFTHSIHMCTQPAARRARCARTFYENEDTHKHFARKFFGEFHLNARVPSMVALVASWRLSTTSAASLCFARADRRCVVL